MIRQATRREFLHASSTGLSTLAWAAGSSGWLPHGFTRSQPRSANESLGIGVIGLRYQGSVIAHRAADYGKVVAVCDVDRHVRDQAKASFGSTPFACEDYRDLLERADVDVVLIGTPDHWHSKMVVDACRAGKDVYVEKPLTLTVDEGRVVQAVVQETGRVVQVGSWQRSDGRFRQAVEMVHAGRIGRLRRVEVVLGKNITGGPFIPRTAPAHFNWNLWQGQTPDVPYIEERAHYTFRWWLEYSGGQLTDWGAHHLDIAQWAIGHDPISVQAVGTLPQRPDSFNVPIDYSVEYRYPNDITMTVKDHGDNGILLIGDKGRMFVNRGRLSGAPVEDLASSPLPREAWTLYPDDSLERPLRQGKLDAIINHMGNFFDCVRSRRQPISDVPSQHRSAVTCHMANISLRLGRALTWDAQGQVFVNDTEANGLLARPQRTGFEVR